MSGLRLFFIVLYIVMVGNVLGCVTPVTPEQIQSADYGKIPDSYQESIQNHMQNVLIDPYSAHYRYFGSPAKGYAYVHGSQNPPEFGYLVNVGVNAKNRMGGYVGEKPYTFLFKNTTFWQLEDYRTREIVK